MDSPLRKLISEDSQSLNQQKLADFLEKFVVIDASSKEIGVISDFQGLKNPEILEIILMASKARALVFEEQEEGMSPAEVMKLNLMATGSVKTALKILFDTKKIKKDGKGKYFLPGYRINQIIDK